CRVSGAPTSRVVGADCSRAVTPRSLFARPPRTETGGRSNTHPASARSGCGPEHRSHGARRLFNRRWAPTLDPLADRLPQLERLHEMRDSVAAIAGEVL